MGEGDAFSFHHVHAHRCRIQQQVNDVVIEQIDLVYIK